MSWVRIDDGVADHPKFLRLAELSVRGERGSAAAWLWTCGLTYCNRHRTDGYIPTAKVPQLFPVRTAMTLASILVEVGLWERVEGGYQVHDFLAYQPSAKKTAEVSERRVEAGRKGGLSRHGLTASRQRVDSEPTASRQRVDSELTASRQRADSEPTASRPEVLAAHENGQANCLERAEAPSRTRAFPTQPNPKNPPSPPGGSGGQGQPDGADGAQPGTELRLTPRPALPSAPELDLGQPQNAAQRKLVERHRVDALAVFEALSKARERAIPKSRRIEPRYSSLAGIASRIEAGYSVADCLAVVAAYEAECRRDAASAKWFDAVTPWRPANFERALARAPAAASTAPPSAPGGNAAPDIRTTQPCGKPWPDEIAGFLRGASTVAEAERIVEQIRRAEPYRFDAEGVARW